MEYNNNNNNNSYHVDPISGFRLRCVTRFITPIQADVPWIICTYIKIL